MAVYDGNKAAQEHLLDIAKACILAAAKAPTLTHRLGLRMEISPMKMWIPYWISWKPWGRPLPFNSTMPWH